MKYYRRRHTTRDSDKVLAVAEAAGLFASTAQANQPMLEEGQKLLKGEELFPEHISASDLKTVVLLATTVHDTLQTTASEIPDSISAAVVGFILGQKLAQKGHSLRFAREVTSEG